MQYKWPDIQTFRTVLKNNFRLRKHYPQQSTILLLQKIYPTVNWNRVDYYEGLPWYTPFAAPYVSAQALPNFYALGRFRIYLKKFDESRAQCLADIVHEAYHVTQGMSYAKGYGFGFTRVWMILYLADFFKNGYRQNVFEIPAYDQEYAFLAFCEAQGLHGIQPAVSSETINSLHIDPALVFHKAAWPNKIVWWGIIPAILLCLIISFGKPILDIIFGLVRATTLRGKAN